MLQSVKIAAIRVVGERRSEVEQKVGKRILQICNKKILSSGVFFSCNVNWVDNPESMNFEAIITVHYNYDISDIEKRHCDICRETHDLFYCNRQYNCNQCEFAAFKVRMEDRQKAMKSGGKFALSGNS